MKINSLWQRIRNSREDENDILPAPHVEGQLHRNLKERHMTMIALGGTIGTGLFLASGQALASSGPAGVLVSYVIVSIMVYFVMTSLGELATHLPISGSFNTYGSRFVDEAFGFALSYNYYFSWVVTIAGELGTEAVGIAAGESANPRRDVPRAMNQVIWRIILFFIGTIIVMGLIIRYDDPRLSNIHGVQSVAVSPFTLVFLSAGWTPAVHIMNAVILTTVLSAGNSGLYLCTRILWTLAMEGKAPQIFCRLTKGGIPIWCLALTTVLATIFFGLSFIGNQIVYQWLVNLSGVMGFIAWFGIALSHWRFRRAYIAQGYALEDLPYKALFYPFGPIFASILIFVAVFGQGYTAFTTHPFNFNSFLSAYISIPVFLILFGIYKFVKKTRFVPLREIDLMTGSLREREEQQKVHPYIVVAADRAPTDIDL
ncbi:unnamed protein product [Rotaria magnacalcarata]|uniref:Amino acid permease/ SLC12A domain-containing protein n=2 Tax=Rotaria magnacalcarata TaxID=392030 RepID=A0A819HBF7_9BILA|nr:unnamed protein product [Rotaria magnacalcarata]CAF3928844.1 unnamed protein product [Rotaria magnacalcarata]